MQPNKPWISDISNQNESSKRRNGMPRKKEQKRDPHFRRGSSSRPQISNYDSSTRKQVKNIKVRIYDFYHKVSICGTIKI